MKFWAVVALFVGAVIAYLSRIGPSKYRHEPPRKGRKGRKWRIG